MKSPCKVTDDLHIGAFICFGDAELTVACAKAMLELLSVVITALFCLLSAKLQPGNDNAVGMDANLMLLGAGFMLYGVFNLVFFACLYPVSYTHLDVYKRQVHQQDTHPAVFCEHLGAVHSAPVAVARDALQRDGRIDVYKRQGQRHLPAHHPL